MSNIPIADGFGLNIQAALDPKSAFAKYFETPPSFAALQQDLASLQDLPLTGLPSKSMEIGLTFSLPTAVAATSPQFAGSAAVSASLCVVTGGKLFDPDPFDSPIEIPSGRAFVGLGVKASVAPALSGSSGNLAFGFTAGGTLTMSHYKSFATSATSPAFKDALQASVGSYLIPLGFEDLANLGVGDVALVEGTGTLQATGTVNLLTSVNPLASVTSSVLPAAIQVTEGATINVKACCKITGELQIRIQKVDAGTVRMGFFRKRGAEFTVEIDPSVGLTAGTSSVDFIATLLSAIGPSPLPSTEQLEKAGLTEEKREAVVGALKAAIQRALALSVQAELDALSSHEAAFLYEVTLKDVGPDGARAIQDALRLNVSALSATPSPSGITEVQSLLTTTRTKGHTLKFNLLGIYNYTSVNDLTLKGTVLADPSSGKVLITDRATATHVSGAINFLADPEKLRKVLAQSFLITAAYRCSGLVAHAPTLKASYWHFAELARTSHDAMAANLHALSSLRLISAAEETQHLTPAGDFGRSTFYLNTDYDDALSQRLFLGDDGQPRGFDEYERLGRDALQLLYPPGCPDDYRGCAVQDDLWPQVKKASGVVDNLREVFPDLTPDLQLPNIAGDYRLIEWWATTMANMAHTLSSAQRFFAQEPPPASDSPEFKKVQADLWHQMADVASKTHDRFSDPWGLLAMDLVSGQKSQASGQIVSAGLTLRVERPSTAGV